MSEEKDETNANPEEQKKQDNNKVEKRYEDNLNKATSLLQGNRDLLTKPSKINNDQITGIIDEFFADEIKEKKEVFKKKLKDTIVASINFHKEISKAEQDLKNTIISKKKDMNKVYEDLFKEMKDINGVHRDFLAAMKGATQPAEADKQD